jgi:hypothetical protein
MIDAWLSWSEMTASSSPSRRLEEAAVRVEARAEENRVVGAEKLGQPLLELAVHGLRAADEADGGQPVAPAVESLVRRLDDRRVVGKGRGSCSRRG